MADYNRDLLREIAAITDTNLGEDNLAGVTRETLVEAEITKHKELLTPDTAPLSLHLASEQLTALAEILADIRDELDGLNKHIRKLSSQEHHAGN
jgi:hypothetical protein